MSKTELIVELRKRTGAGMSDCKKALDNSNDDINAAIDWLRIKGIANSQKKSDRSASEGLIGVFCDNTKSIMVELNCETDFVSRNDDFQSFLMDFLKFLSQNLSENIDLDSILSMRMDGILISDHLNALVTKCGENIVLRRVNAIFGESVFFYVHGQVKSVENITMGRIGVCVQLKSEASELASIGKDLAMHASFGLPRFIKAADVTTDVIDKERSILIEQAKEAGASDEVISKSIDGKLKKFLSTICFYEQSFIKEPKLNVGEFLSQKSKEFGYAIDIENFKVFVIGSE